MSLDTLPIFYINKWMKISRTKIRERALVDTGENSPREVYVVGRSDYSIPDIEPRGRGKNPCIIIDPKHSWGPKSGKPIAHEKSYRIIELDQIKSYETLEKF